MATRRKYPRRWRLEVLLCRFQASQRVRRLRVTWQRWAGAQGAAQLSQSLVSGLGRLSPPHTLRQPRCNLASSESRNSTLWTLLHHVLFTVVSELQDRQRAGLLGSMVKGAPLVIPPTAPAMAPGTGLEGMATTSTAAASGQADTAARRQLGPFPGRQWPQCQPSNQGHHWTLLSRSSLLGR